MEYATVTVDAALADEAVTDRVLDELRGLSPAICWDAGRAHVVVTVDAPGLAVAANTACSTVQRAAACDLVSVEVLGTLDFDARNGVGP